MRTCLYFYIPIYIYINKYIYVYTHTTHLSFKLQVPGNFLHTLPQHHKHRSSLATNHTALQRYISFPSWSIALSKTLKAWVQKWVTHRMPVLLSLSLKHQYLSKPKLVLWTCGVISALPRRKATQGRIRDGSWHDNLSEYFSFMLFILALPSSCIPYISLHLF